LHMCMCSEICMLSSVRVFGRSNNTSLYVTIRKVHHVKWGYCITEHYIYFYLSNLSIAAARCFLFSAFSENELFWMCVFAILHSVSDKLMTISFSALMENLIITDRQRNRLEQSSTF